MNAVQLSIKLATQSIARTTPVRWFKIYTKTGDAGTSVTYSGDRRLKFDPIFEALGTSDELSSSIGHARSFMKTRNFAELEGELRKIQCILQDLQSSLATPQNAPMGMLEKVRFDVTAITFLEERIDFHCENLPPLKNFILPGGGPAASALQIARDYLFTAARVANAAEGGDELIYK